jgi:hypothetical protein
MPNHRGAAANNSSYPQLPLTACLQPAARARCGRRRQTTNKSPPIYHWTASWLQRCSRAAAATVPSLTRTCLSPATPCWKPNQRRPHQPRPTSPLARPRPRRKARRAATTEPRQRLSLLPGSLSAGGSPPPADRSVPALVTNTHPVQCTSYIEVTRRLPPARPARQGPPNAITAAAGLHSRRGDSPGRNPAAHGGRAGSGRGVASLARKGLGAAATGGGRGPGRAHARRGARAPGGRESGARVRARGRCAGAPPPRCAPFSGSRSAALARAGSRGRGRGGEARAATADTATRGNRAGNASHGRNGARP